MYHQPFLFFLREVVQAACPPDMGAGALLRGRTTISTARPEAVEGPKRIDAPRPGHNPQMDFLRAETGYAFTTFDAIFAATFTSLPNIILLPAGRAALYFSLGGL